MTAPKRWPKRAEAARLESLAAAMQIHDYGQQAKAALLAGHRELALYLVSEMQLAAQEIRHQLLAVKAGRE